MKAMKTAVVILDVVTGLLIFSTLICGLWIKAQPEVDPSSVSFHLGIALLTSGFVVVSLLVSTVAVFRLAA
jgi:hypothetical protein